MEIAQLLTVGDKLELQVREITSKGQPLIISQVADIQGNRIYIAAAFKEGRPYPLSLGQRLNIIFYKEEKGVFYFFAEIKDRINNHFPAYEIQPLGEAIRIQRRDFYRFETALKVVVQDIYDYKPVTGVTKDISGGGMKFYAPREFGEETPLEGILYFDEENYVAISGMVARCQYEEERKEYVVRVSFNNIREAVRGKIIAYIFDRQRSLRKKGLI